MKHPTVKVYVQTCKDRDASDLLAALRAEGVEPEVYRDETDYFRVRNEWRWYGQLENFVRILDAEQDEDWKITMQDDVSFAPGTIEKMRHILARAPGGSVAFYNPTNRGFREAWSRGHHVLRTGSNFWGQCFAFTTERARELAEWKREHVILGYNGDDALVGKFNYWTGNKTDVVLPSLVQHEGFDRSMMGTAATVAGYARQSETFDPEFDPATVDWFENFSKPYRDGMAKRDLKGLIGLTKQGRTG